jgi:nitroimidazol reductase NimA-like FMN-containing flavoprotein (pyridoxamine 5'-phosphate oxidase superfamily)
LRRKDKLVSDKKLIYEAINRAVTCRVAMVDGDKPYVVHMCFGFNGDYFYLHSAPAGRKVNLLRKNPWVCLELATAVEVVRGSNPCSWSVRYFSVICEGYADTVEDRAQKNHALNVINRHYDKEAQDHIFSEKELDSVLVYRIKPDSMSAKASGSDLNIFRFG